jgi:hypothetical protein
MPNVVAPFESEPILIIFSSKFESEIRFNLLGAATLTQTTSNRTTLIITNEVERKVGYSALFTFWLGGMPVLLACSQVASF